MTGAMRVLQFRITGPSAKRSIYEGVYDRLVCVRIELRA